MASLKEVRTRIASVKSTQQITSAMKMVAASKLRRAQNAILALRPYASRLSQMMGQISANTGDIEAGVYAELRKPEKVLIIAIASNRGLCGAFNANVIKMTMELIRTHYADQHRRGEVHILAFGKKVDDFFNRRNYTIIGPFNSIFDNLSFDQVAPVAMDIMEAFREKAYDKVEIVYNQFKNAAVQRLTVEQYLPILPPQASATDPKQNTQLDYLYEPNQEEILNDLIPRSLKIQLYKALLDSVASEHGARMTAMHKATDNAQDMLRDLRLMYNKARQATITKEILEIVSGAEALKG
jgi:F-type H+-transporting ATPase subunit gamma